MKRILMVVLTALLLCLGACSALAAVENGFYYDVENGGAVVISYGFNNDNPERKLVIPDTLGGYPVTAIGYNAFDGCDWLTNVTLPKSLKKISWYAFSGCYNLSEIDIPYGVTVIGRGAFSDCYSLKTVNLPDTLVQIDGHAFQNCIFLEEITIPAGVERLTTYTFGGCWELKEVNIKGRETQIYPDAFSNDGSDVGYIMTLDTDNVIFRCWRGMKEYSYAYSPEMFAVKRSIRNIEYYDEEVPPPIAAPVPPTIEDIPEDIVEIGYPVVIVPLLNNSKGQYKDGSVYEPEKDGFIIDRVPIQKDDGNGNTCTVEYEMVPCDAHGNELKFWEGEAYTLFFYKDFIINGEPLTRKTIEQYNFKIAHEYEKGKFEYFDTDDIVFEKQGFRVKIQSLSPFKVTVTSNENARKVTTTAPVLKSFDSISIKEYVEEYGAEFSYPVVIVPDLDKSEGKYQNGDPYDPTAGLITERVPIEVGKGSAGSCTVKYNMKPYDEKLNELKSWNAGKGEAYIFFFYKDFVIDGKQLDKEDVALYDFRIAHEYEKGKIEYFDKADMSFKEDGFCVKINSLSPFTATVGLDLDGVEDIPQTGDTSMNLMALLAVFVLSACAAVVIRRKRA